MIQYSKCCIEEREKNVKINYLYFLTPILNVLVLYMFGIDFLL